jgi:hypothetical protein
VTGVNVDSSGLEDERVQRDSLEAAQPAYRLRDARDRVVTGSDDHDEQSPRLTIARSGDAWN